MIDLLFPCLCFEATELKYAAQKTKHLLGGKSISFTKLRQLNNKILKENKEKTMQLHCFSFQFFIMLLVFLLFQGQWSSVECVRLDPHGAKYVRELVNEFLADPTSSRFDQIILPPQIGEELSDFLHPKVYIWCPITHWKIEVKCPLHGCLLTPGTFTDVVDKTSPKNPRLNCL